MRGFTGLLGRGRGIGAGSVEKGRPLDGLLGVRAWRRETPKPSSRTELGKGLGKCAIIPKQEGRSTQHATDAVKGR